MDDPHGPTRVMPPTAPQTRQTVPPDDFRIKQVERAVGAEYDVLGEICEIGEGGEGGIAFLAQRRSTTRLDVLRLVRSGTDVDVLGAIGQAFPLGDDLCPTATRRFAPACASAELPRHLFTLPHQRRRFIDDPEQLGEGRGARNQYQLLGRVDEVVSVDQRESTRRCAAARRMPST
jgi:hypothetical protein